MYFDLTKLLVLLSIDKVLRSRNRHMNLLHSLFTRSVPYQYVLVFVSCKVSRLNQWWQRVLLFLKNIRFSEKKHQIQKSGPFQQTSGNVYKKQLIWEKRPFLFRSTFFRSTHFQTKISVICEVHIRSWKISDLLLKAIYIRFPLEILNIRLQVKN